MVWTAEQHVPDEVAAVAEAVDDAVAVPGLRNRPPTSNTLRYGAVEANEGLVNRLGLGLTVGGRSLDPDGYDGIAGAGRRVRRP